MTPKFWMETRSGQFLDWLFPDGHKTCVICHHVLPDEKILAQIRRLDKHASDGKQMLWDLVCPLCLQEFARLRPESPGRSLVVSYEVRGTDASTNTREARVPVYSCYRYEGLIQRLVRPWKYDGALGIGLWFAEELAKVLTAEDWRGVDAIVPVPTSQARLHMRGYHHTLLLAKRLAKNVGVPVWQGLLRNSGSETQTAKSATERQAVIQTEMMVPDEVECSGRRLVLLDDVVTTGSTLHGCAQKLLEAGASSVECLVIAYVK